MIINQPPGIRHSADSVAGSRTSHSPAQARARRGLLFSEVIVAVPILGMLVALAAAGVLSYQKSRHEATARQTAAWAAAAQLERIQAGAAPDSRPPAGVLSPDVELSVGTTPGKGAWEGFQLVTVSAGIVLNDKQKVAERISGYVRTEVKP
ncbi:MAG: hypothetical protein HRF43_16575 [Phycisphaerae bacterium]|jgi:Tfp pilus assembly protein PilV